MLELLYPVDKEAPLMPARSAASRRSASDRRSSSDSRGEEFFPVIEECGIVIGRAARSYCHSGSHLLHPVVHLHIISRDEKIYLQKRSASKRLLPLKWDTAVGGHVIYGEGIMEALRREAMEELNFTEFNPIYLGSYRWDTDRDSEMVNIFAAVGSFPDLKPDGDEVEEGRWWTIPQVEGKLSSGIFTPNFAEEFREIKPALLSLL